MLVAEAFAKDPGWFKWLYTQKLAAPEGEEDWLHTLEQLFPDTEQP